MAYSRRRKKYNSKAKRQAKILVKESRRAASIKKWGPSIETSASKVREKKPSRRLSSSIQNYVKWESRLAKVSRPVDATAIFQDSVPGKFRKPITGSGRKIFDIGGGGKPPGPSPSSGASGTYSGIAARAAKTPAGRKAIAGGVFIGGVIVSQAAEEGYQFMYDYLQTRNGSAAQPRSTRLSPAYTGEGIGVYFKNILIGLLTDEQYDTLWMTAATHIRKVLKGL